jgi:hypothetical protein
MDLNFGSGKVKTGRSLRMKHHAGRKTYTQNYSDARAARKRCHHYILDGVAGVQVCKAGQVRGSLLTILETR